MKNKVAPYAPAFGVLLLCILPAFLLSCAANTVSNVAVGEVVDDDEGEVLEKDYIIKDRALSKEIEVVDVKARYVGEFLEGLAVIKNRKKYTVQFEFSFKWYDAEGFPLPSNVSLWTPDLLYGAETKWIKALCPKQGATGFKLMIRRPNPVD